MSETTLMQVHKNQIVMTNTPITACDQLYQKQRSRRTRAVGLPSAKLR